MVTNDQLRLTCYRDIAALDADHGVYLVQDIRTKRVCVKKILTVFDQQVFIRLKNEPVPGIPKIMEAVRNGNNLIVIEQYCPGETLQSKINRKKTFSEQEIAEYMLQLCTILERLHSFTPPVIHRDIKPSNIIISDEGRLYLIDMNAAKFVNTDKKRDTRLLGTEGYAAPEQYGFGSSTTQTDIYAIGMMMGEMLTGNISGTDLRTGKMSRIINRCTQFNPKDRFQSVAALKRALRPLAGKAGGSEPRGIFKYIIPGFRSLDPLHMFIAVLGYAGIFYLSTTFSINNKPMQPVELFMYRVYIALLSLVIVFLSCDYMNVQRFFPLCRVRNPFLKLLAIILLDAAAVIVTYFPFAFMMLIAFPT